MHGCKILAIIISGVIIIADVSLETMSSWPSTQLVAFRLLVRLQPPQNYKIMLWLVTLGVGGRRGHSKLIEGDFHEMRLLLHTCKGVNE